MNRIQNPVVQSAGVNPPELSGRDKILENAAIAIERAKLGRYGKSFIAVEPRGVGKTILLRCIQEIAKSKGCQSIYLEIQEEKELTNILIPALRKILLELNIEPSLGVADTGNIEIDMLDLFCVVGEAIKSRNSALVIILDEIEYLSNKEMSALIMSMHRMAQENLPIILIGAGLPLLIGKMGKSKSYVEMLFDFLEIGALNYTDSLNSLV